MNWRGWFRVDKKESCRHCLRLCSMGHTRTLIPSLPLKFCPAENSLKWGHQKYLYSGEGFPDCVIVSACAMPSVYILSNTVSYYYG